MGLLQTRNGFAGIMARRMSAKNSADFIKRLGEMMMKGFTAGQAIDFLMLNVPGIKARQAAAIQSSLQDGLPIHEILPVLHVPSLVCLQIFFAEQHGNVPATLIHAGTQWEKSIRSKEELVKLLQYPVFLLILLMGLLAVLNTFVLPQFRDLHSSMGYTPGGFIAFLLFFLQWAPPFLLLALPAAGGAGFLAYTQYKLLSPHKKADMLVKIPYIRSFFQLYFTRLFARESAQLLNSGFAVNELLHIFEKQDIFPMLRAVSRTINSRLVKGDTLQEAIGSIPWFDRKLSVLIGHGGTSGRVGEELLLYAEFCDRLVENKIKKATGVIQPAVFLMIGTIVMAVYLSVMLPMFEMISEV